MPQKKYSFVKFLLTSFLLILLQNTTAHSQIDSASVKILDRMSELLGSIESVSFNMEIEVDKMSNNAGLIKNSNKAKVYLRGPNKMLVTIKGDAGNKYYLYNGKTFTYYSAQSNQYAIVDAPATNIETIDFIHNEYGMDFPASDFFYPNFVNDLLQSSSSLLYLGITEVNGKECFHLAGASPENSVTYQFWISNDVYFLPMKMAIVYTDQTGNPQYAGTMSDWDINPKLPDAMFEFTVPTGARVIKLKKSNN